MRSVHRIRHLTTRSFSSLGARRIDDATAAWVAEALEPGEREVWVGMPTVKAILANRLVPGLLDRVLARMGYAAQLSAQERSADAPANLFHSVPGAYGAHGRFDAQARAASPEFFASRHRGAIFGGLLALTGAAIAAHLSRRRALS